MIEIRQNMELEDNFEDILFDACRSTNWTKPWESNGISLTFRAKLLRQSHPEYDDDSGGDNSPGTEQAYRRGVVHGIQQALNILNIEVDSDHPVADAARKIYQWRRSRLHARNSVTWGDFKEPQYQCIVRHTLRRSSLSPKVRFDVLERDGRRCVICGVSAKDGAVLEVDHIVPVSHGGGDFLDNLQTLCFDCNRGKSDRR